MSIRVELKYAMLITLMLLLWLVVEEMAGIHDRYLQLYPYSSFLSLVVPIGCTYRAFVAKRNELNGRLPLRQALITGFLLAVFAALFSLPAQYVFYTLISPDLFQNMIAYTVKYGKSSPEQAAAFFNLKAALVQNFMGVLLSGIVISLAVAFLIRTKNGLSHEE